MISDCHAFTHSQHLAVVARVGIKKEQLFFMATPSKSEQIDEHSFSEKDEVIHLGDDKTVISKAKWKKKRFLTVAEGIELLQNAE